MGVWGTVGAAAIVDVSYVTSNSVQNKVK